VRYDNFGDPLGLIRRMLTSGDPAARQALLRAGARVLATPFDLILSVFERRLIEKTRGGGEDPILLVVGGPRAGTTLVFQVLARQLDVSSTTNVLDVFPRSPIVASRLFGALGRQDSAGELSAFYGNTAPFRGQNDAFEIWNRWLGSDRYQAIDNLTPEAIADMRAFMSAWSAAAGRPLLNKNNRNTGVMGMLADALPTAHFIVVERDPLYMAQSLVFAREVVQGDRSEGWGFGAHPEQSDAFVSVAQQVADVSRIVARETAKVSPHRLTRVGYEAFCDDPGAVVAGIGDRLEIAYEAAGIPPLSPSLAKRLPPDEFSRLEAAVTEQLGN
jgi:Sulfotransferase family